MVLKNYIFAAAIVIAGHLLALYALFHLPQTTQPQLIPNVIEALLITPPALFSPSPVTKTSQPEALPPAKNKDIPVETTIEQPTPDTTKTPVETPLEVQEPDTVNTLPVDATPTATDTVEETIPSPNATAVANTTDSNAQVTLPQNDPGADNQEPAYPRQSRRLGEEGTVLLEIEILENGRVGEIRLKSSSGHSRLDNAAMTTVKNWRYIPARRGNDVISYWHTQSVKFVLN